MFIGGEGLKEKVTSNFENNWLKLKTSFKQNYIIYSSILYKKVHFYQYL